MASATTPLMSSVTTTSNAHIPTPDEQVANDNASSKVSSAKSCTKKGALITSAVIFGLTTYVLFVTAFASEKDRVALLISCGVTAAFHILSVTLTICCNNN